MIPATNAKMHCRGMTVSWGFRIVQLHYEEEIDERTVETKLGKRKSLTLCNPNISRHSSDEGDVKEGGVDS
jgi:hypothetical protein